MSNLMYHIAYINKKLFVAKCFFICYTNLSWHHSLQGVCWSGISGGSATIPGSTSLSLSLSVAGGEGRGSKIFTRQNKSQGLGQFRLVCMYVQDPNAIFLYLTCQTQFQRLRILMKGAVCSTLHMYTSLVLYILNHSKGESRRPCIRSGHSAG